MTERIQRFSSEQPANAAGQPLSPGEAVTSALAPSGDQDGAKKWPTTAAEFDEMFDNGEDIDHLID